MFAATSFSDAVAVADDGVPSNPGLGEGEKCHTTTEGVDSSTSPCTLEVSKAPGRERGGGRGSPDGFARQQKTDTGWVGGGIVSLGVRE